MDAPETYQTWKVLYAKQPIPDQTHVELEDNSTGLLTYQKNFMLRILLNHFWNWAWWRMIALCYWWVKFIFGWQCKEAGLKIAVASSADRIKVDANLAAAGLPQSK